MIGRFAALALLGVLAAGTHAAPVKKAAARVAVRDWSRTVVATPEGGARMGNPAAPVKLIEYGSRTCPHCAHFAAEGVPALKAGYVARGQVSYEFRDYPIHNALDIGPILLGHCVPVAGFFPLLDAMMAGQDSLVNRAAQVPPAELERLGKATASETAAYLATFYGYVDLAVKRGMPSARAKACLADEKAIDTIVARADAAYRLYKVTGTPTFIVNGTVAGGASDWATLEPVLRAAGAK